MPYNTAQNAESTNRWQIDALKLEPFIDSFVEGLGLSNGYTVIVVNPKWSDSAMTYGFRAGFSAEEIDDLQEEVKGRACHAVCVYACFVFMNDCGCVSCVWRARS